MGEVFSAMREKASSQRDSEVQRWSPNFGQLIEGEVFNRKRIPDEVETTGFFSRLQIEGGDGSLVGRVDPLRACQQV